MRDKLGKGSAQKGKNVTAEKNCRRGGIDQSVGNVGELIRQKPKNIYWGKKGVTFFFDSKKNPAERKAPPRLIEKDQTM